MRNTKTQNTIWCTTVITGHAFAFIPACQITGQDHVDFMPEVRIEECGIIERIKAGGLPRF